MIKEKLKIILPLFLALILSCASTFAEVTKSFTATLPSTRPGQSGSFDLTIGGLSGTGYGTLSDTKTGFFKYTLDNTSTGWWASKSGTTKFGLQMSSLQILQSFVSGVLYVVLNGKNNAAEDDYVCPTAAGPLDYNWIYLKARTPDALGGLHQNFTQASFFVGGKAQYSQSSGQVTWTGQTAFDLATLNNYSLAYTLAPHPSALTCATTEAARQRYANQGYPLLDDYGFTWFGKLNASNAPYAAYYLSSKGSPTMALFAPKQTLDTSIMSSLSQYRFAALYTNWDSRTSVTTKTALITPNAQGTSFAISDVADPTDPTVTTSLGTLTCAQANWNLPSQGFCKGTLTLAASPGLTGNSVCLISNTGNQNVFSCIAQNPLDPKLAITIVSTYSKKANVIVTPSYSQVGSTGSQSCDIYTVNNCSNRYIPSVGVPSDPAQQLSGDFSMHPDSFSGTNGFCSATLPPYTTCNVKVCATLSGYSAGLTTTKIAFDDGVSTVNSTATTIKVPTVLSANFNSPDGNTITCSAGASTASLSKLSYIADYGGGHTQDLLSGTNSIVGCALSNTAKFSNSNCVISVNCSLAAEGEQTNVYALDYSDGDLTDYDGQITLTTRLTPYIASVSPTAGSVSGGGTLTLTGSGFVSGATVRIGGNLCTSPSVISSTSMTCTIPLGTTGSKTVQVTNPNTLSYSLSSAYTYNLSPTVTSVSPAGGALNGGTSVTITGTRFANGTTAKIGGVTCTSPTINSSTSLSCTTGAHAAGVTDIVVTNVDTLTGTGSNLFTYGAPPDPTSPSATASSTSQIALSWTSGGAYTASYKVAYQSGNTAPANCATGTVVATNNTSLTISSLSAATQYSFRICALNTGTTPDVSSGATISATTKSNATLAFSEGASYSYGTTLTKNVTYQRIFTLTNTVASGNASATNLSGANFGGGSKFDWKGGTFPGTGGTCGTVGHTTLAPSDTCTVVITFSASNKSSFSDTATVNYNNGTSNTSVSISLSATTTQ